MTDWRWGWGGVLQEIIDLHEQTEKKKQLFETQTTHFHLLVVV